MNNISFIVRSRDVENDWPAEISIRLWFKRLSFDLKIPDWVIPDHQEIKYYSKDKSPYRAFIRRQYGFSFYGDIEQCPAIHFYWGIQDDNVFIRTHPFHLSNNQ